jgi:WD40 repeat protein
MRLLPVRSGHIIALRYSPDGSQLAACAHLWGRVWLWDLRRSEAQLLEDARRIGPRPYASPTQSRAALGYSSSGTLLAIGRPNQVGLRDRQTSITRYFLNALCHHTRRLAFTPDEETLVSAGLEHDAGDLKPVVALWDVSSGRKRKLPTPFPAGTQALAITPDASIVLWYEPPVPRVPAHLTLWHIPGLRKLARMSLSTPPTCAVFSPTARRLAVAVENGVLLYEIGHILDFLADFLGSSPWASLTLPIRWKRSARLVPMARPQLLEGHEDRVQALAFSPDGAMLFSGGRDRIVRCWDLASLRERDAWCWPIGVVYSLAVAPDGMTAAAGGNAGRTVIWDLL